MTEEKGTEAASSGALVTLITEVAKTLRELLRTKLAWAVIGLLAVSFVVSDELSVAAVVSLVREVGSVIVGVATAGINAVTGG